MARKRNFARLNHFIMKKVLKFGGSSVAGADQIRRVVDIVSSQPRPCAVVVSALGGMTDMLKALANAALANHHEEMLSQILDRHLETIDDLLDGQLRDLARTYTKERVDELDVICQGIFMLQELSERSQARLMSFGELVSSFIIAQAVKTTFADTKRLDARQFIVTDDQLMKAAVDMTISTRKTQEAFHGVEGIVVVPGFIASTGSGVTSTLGRGGSDYTAAILAKALNSEVLEIWSDVSGMLTANPRAVPQAQNIAKMSYNEAFELSHFGAKVLYPPAIQPAYEHNIPVLLKNTFEPTHPGTLINEDVHTKEQIVSGISSIDKVAMVNLTGIGMVGVSGYSSRVFSALHRGNINVVMIAQSCSERGICIAIDQRDLDETQIVLNEAFGEEISSGRIDPIKLEDDLSIIALVGDGMKYRSGVSGRIFSVLGDYGINIRAIAQGSSESNISIIINSSEEQKALRKLHENFFENKPTPIHLFIAGMGNVGREFISLVQTYSDNPAHDTHTFHMNALANSQKMILSSDGIELKNTLEKLQASDSTSDLLGLINFAKKLDVPNKVFIDNTPSPLTAPYYSECLQHDIHVVTCNKIVASGPSSYFDELTSITRKSHAQFLYETNVGAALPVIGTIKQMVLSGDRIHRIQAVLSGSLNFIYDLYNGQTSFANVVREAGKLGYTEPNPMDDLSGTDVMRKIVILARAANQSCDLEDVILTKDMPEACYDAASIKEVFTILDEQELFFKDKFERANSSEKKLKYIAEMKGNELHVGLQEIDADHPFYSLQGTDNMVAIYSDRYHEQPLIIQGAGAGAINTAAGVLTDVLTIDFIA